jgi:hypothetical protein
VFEPLLNHQPNEVVLLHSGAVLSEHLTNTDSPSDFDLRVKSALTLILLRKDLWEEIRDRRNGGIERKDPTPELPTAAADFGARLYSKSQSVLKTIERGRMSARTGAHQAHMTPGPISPNRALTAPDVGQGGSHSRPTVKYRSKESRKISAILGGTMGGGGARHSGEVGVGIRVPERQAQAGMVFTISSAVAIPPPGTVRNPFAPSTVPPVPVVPKVLNSDLRTALLKTFLDTALFKGSASKVESGHKMYMQYDVPPSNHCLYFV